MKVPTVCRYCGGVIRLVPAESIFGKRTRKLGMEGEQVYQCQNCNARVCCHKGTTRPLGDVANEVLRLKRIEAHQAFDAMWRSWHISRTQGEVSAIPVPDAINELADDILCELRRNGLTVSDRKYLNYYPLAQAKAWLDGHDKVTPKDLLILKCYLWDKPGDRAVVESVLNRLCVNPMQDKVNEVRSMAAECEDEFNTALHGAEPGKSGSRALIKLRGELVRLYARQQELDAAAESEAEKVMASELLYELEKISKTAAEAVNFTYMPLDELAALQ